MNAIFRCLAMGSALFLTALSAMAEDRLTVFAAASLKDALEHAAQASGQEVTFSFAGSGLIARQVTQGAPADLVILANEAWMTWLTEQSPAVLPPQGLASNSLVVVGATDAEDLHPDDMLNRLGTGRLALGQTRAVPAGIYARQWLEKSGLWAALHARLAETENVRAALALVARGEAPLGIVYASDAQAERRVRVLYAVPSHLHAPISYPMAVLDGDQREAAQAFATFLTSEEGAAILAAHGFAAPREAAQ